MRTHVPGQRRGLSSCPALWSQVRDRDSPPCSLRSRQMETLRSRPARKRIAGLVQMAAGQAKQTPPKSDITQGQNTQAEGNGSEAGGHGALPFTEKGSPHWTAC